MPNWIIYIYPLVFDIIVGLTLFAGRHSFGELKLGTGTIGSSWLIYGIGYMLCSMFMGRIVTAARAKSLILVSAGAATIVLLGLAHARNIRLIQVLFCGIPLVSGLFFNSFQAYMLGVDTGTRKPLALTIAHYTFAWSLGYAMGPPHARELLTTMAGSLLSRYLGSQVAKLVPGLGWIVSAVISAVTTWGIGQAARGYFEAGRAVKGPELRGMYQQMRRLAPRRLFRRRAAESLSSEVPLPEMPEPESA